MRRTGPLVAAAAVLALAPILSACSSSDPVASQTPTSSGAEPRTGGSIVMGTGGETTGWSPHADRWGPGAINVARAIFDPLVVTGEDGNWHPWLAESFSSEDDNKTWLIKVRKGITFHNGEKVDAHAVVYNLVAFQKAPLTTFAFQPVREITKVDDYTAKVTLDQAWGNFPALFAGQAGFMVAPSQITSGDNRKPIGSGPFRFESWTPDIEVKVSKNPTYWRKDPAGRALPYLDRVTFKPIVDESSRSSALASGDIDLLHTQSPSVTSRLLKGEVEPGFVIIRDTSEGDEMTVVLNTQSGVLSDEKLRKAIQLSTDRKAIIGLFEDQFELADGPFTEKSPWWTASGWPEPDIGRARQLVDDWKSRNPGQEPRVRLPVIATNDGLQLAQALQSMWKEAGFVTDIDSQEETKFSGTLLGGDFDALLFQFWPGGDPDVNFHFWTGKNVGEAGSISLNFPRWTNAETEAALNKGRSDTDPAARKADYAIVWKQWAEHVPFVFIYHSVWVVHTRPNVHGITDVNLPDGSGKATPIDWGTINLSNAWTDTPER